MIRKERRDEKGRKKIKTKESERGKGGGKMVKKLEKKKKKTIMLSTRKSGETSRTNCGQNTGLKRGTRAAV